MLTLHCAGGVEGPRRRRVLSLRFLGDDVTHAPRAWKTSPDFPGLADELAAGAPDGASVVPGRLGTEPMIRRAALGAGVGARGRTLGSSAMAVDESSEAVQRDDRGASFSGSRS